MLITPSIGGPAETFIRRHVETIAPGKTSLVTAARAHDGAWDAPKGMPVLEIGKIRQPFVLRALRKLRRLLGLTIEEATEVAIRRFAKQTGADVALSEWMHIGMPYFRVCRSLGIPFFLHAHGLDVTLRQLTDPACQEEYRTYADAAGVITVSKLQKTRLIDLVGLPAEKIHVNYLGVDIPAAMPERGESDVVTCVSIGRMVAKKAPLVTLEAFRRAYQRNANLRLKYIGDGPLLEAAMQYSADHGLGGVVRFLGTQPSDVTLSHLRAADIFLLHSIVDPVTGDEEGLPVVIMEAMANGVPVVSTHHAGIPEAVEHGETGYLVAENDEAAMADHIQALARDRDLRLRLGNAAWQVAGERFDAAKSVARLRGLLGLS